MARSSFAASALIAIVCIAIWAPAPGSGNFVDPGAGLNFLGLPWGLPCLQAVLGTEGCAEELVSSFLSLQPQLIGPQCCKAAISVEDSCWPKIFPLNPFFPPLLKSFCATKVPLPPSP